VGRCGRRSRWEISIMAVALLFKSTHYLQVYLFLYCNMSILWCFVTPMLWWWLRCHCSIQQHVLPIHNCVSMNLQKNKITNTLLVILHGIVPHETQFIATCSQVTAITLLSSVADLTEDMTLRRKHVIRVITGNTAKITVVCLCCLHCLRCSHSLVWPST